MRRRQVEQKANREPRLDDVAGKRVQEKHAANGDAREWAVQEAG